jgi:hypothetical protein
MGAPGLVRTPSPSFHNLARPVGSGQLGRLLLGRSRGGGVPVICGGFPGKTVTKQRNVRCRQSANLVRTATFLIC